MDAMLARLVRRVLVDTHAEHLADRVVSRVLSAIRTFHNRPENFVQDAHDATFETSGCVYDDSACLGSLFGLRKVLAVLVYLECGEQVEARLAKDALEYFKGGAGGSGANYPAYALRIGNTLKVKSTQPFLAFTVIYNAPPIVTEDKLGTWLTEQQLEFAVSEATGYTFEQIGDDSANAYLRRGEMQIRQLVSGLDVM